MRGEGLASVGVAEWRRGRGQGGRRGRSELTGAVWVGGAVGMMGMREVAEEVDWWR